MPKHFSSQFLSSMHGSSVIRPIFCFVTYHVRIPLWVPENVGSVPLCPGPPCWDCLCISVVLSSPLEGSWGAHEGDLGGSLNALLSCLTVRTSTPFYYSTPLISTMKQLPPQSFVLKAHYLNIFGKKLYEARAARLCCGDKSLTILVSHPYACVPARRVLQQQLGNLGCFHLTTA